MLAILQNDHAALGLHEGHLRRTQLGRGTHDAIGFVAFAETLQQLHRAAAFDHDLPRLDECAAHTTAGDLDEAPLRLAALLGIEPEELRPHPQTMHARQIVRRIGIEHDTAGSQSRNGHAQWIDVGYAGIVQDRQERRNIWIALLLVGTSIVCFTVAGIVSRPPSPPATVEKRPGPDQPPSAAPLPPPPPVQKADLDAPIETLDRWLSTTAASTSDFAVLLHAVRGLGPNHDLNGKTTRQAFLERVPSALMVQEGKPILSPLQAGGEIAGRELGGGGPLTDLAVLAVLLEADVPLDQPVIEKITVGSWLEQVSTASVAAKPNEGKTSDEWSSRNWLIDVLSIAAARGVETAITPSALERLKTLTRSGFDQLSHAHGLFNRWTGKGTLVALQARDTLEQTMQQGLGPYALEGWGLPLAQSVERAVTTLNQTRNTPDAALDDASRQLVGQLVVRQLFERQRWAPKDPLPSAHPIDHFGYCGRLLEALAWTRLAIASGGSDERRDEIAPTVRDCVSTLSRLIVPLRLTTSAAQPAAPPTASDDAQATALRNSAEAVSQALRGLRLVRRAYWPAPPSPGQDNSDSSQ